MWPRVVEIMLGVWLAMSPFIFNHRAEDVTYWITDFSAALALWTLGLLSFWGPTRRAHWLVLLVGFYLVGYGWFTADYPYSDIRAPDYEPALQNYVLVGILLLMFGVLPNDNSNPAPTWRAEPQTWRIKHPEAQSPEKE